jgi:hypothetical protein
VIPVNKKSFVAIAAISLFVISVSSALQVGVADANPIPWAFNPQMTITIQYPKNETISALPVLVSFTSLGDFQFSVSDDLTQEWVRSFFYVIDGQNMGTSGIRFEGIKNTTISPRDPVYKYNFSGQAYLTNLADGLHSITVYYGALHSKGPIGSLGESIHYNQAWQATSQLYVDSKLASGVTLTPSPTPTVSPTVPEFPTVLAITFPIMITVAFAVVFKRKNKHGLKRL